MKKNLFDPEKVLRQAINGYTSVPEEVLLQATAIYFHKNKDSSPSPAKFAPDDPA